MKLRLVLPQQVIFNGFFGFMRIPCHRQLKVDPHTGEKRSLLIVILLVLPTDFWTRPIAFLFA